MIDSSSKNDQIVHRHKIHYLMIKKSFVHYLLYFFITLLIINALPAGVMFIIDPSGAIIGLSTELLAKAPFGNFLIPGLFLLLVMGLLPIVILYGLVNRSKIVWAERINLYKEMHWSWTYSFYLGLVMIIWINIQLLMMKEYSFLQVVISLLGVAIIIVTHLPKTKNYYRSTAELN